MSEIYRVRGFCGGCGEKRENLKTIMGFRDIPLAGDFPLKKDFLSSKKYELNLLFCDNCKLVQTDSIIDPKELFEDYRYISSIGLKKHFEELSSILIKKYKMDKWPKGKHRLMEIGSNSGPLLTPLTKKGIQCFGFDPAKNIVEKFKGDTIVVNDFFSDANARKYLKRNFVDVVVTSNCFAHIENINDIINGIKYCMKKNGNLVIEVHYLRSLIDGLQYDNIYHEHIYYYSLTSLQNLFKRHKMSIIDVEEIPIHSGSIRVTVKKGENLETRKVKKFLKEEESIGINNFDYYKDFSARVFSNLRLIKSTVMHLKERGAKIAGYGASGRATMICNLADLNPEEIDYIVDESPERYGRLIATKGIPIVKSIDEKNKPEYIIIFAWNFARMIMEKLDGKGYKFIIPLPRLLTVQTIEELDSLVSL